MNFTQYIQARKDFLQRNSQKDYVYIDKGSNILLSCPHGVVQTRLGAQKTAELGSLNLALYLHETQNLNLIAKTMNNFDDANFDEVSPYKEEIKKNINKIDYIIDIHGLSGYEPSDINLGINFGKNILKNKELFDTLVNMLTHNGFVVSVDQPLSGGANTIAGTFADENTWAIQIEVNYHITNNPRNKKKLTLLVNVLKLWLDTIKNDRF